ncbi:hypothetical protein N7539_002467 [Penicillium diatomitis]|uniref:F-box domain-containing protein n=1 Tax=Penicillium diatomitis TaxID=2819901 RepID=A0A9X0BYP0_9EURO|nr:uncharacterized protein N7539_002467 [Penicillium diatomitis]KAJ5490900.1 hypothetical protein N7539_002467 [Penicillium diatomitis]
MGTTELLESILLQLDLKSLLTAQEVCQGWRQTIDQSVQLQQALYIRPAKGCRMKRAVNPLMEEVVLQQLLLRSRNYVIPGQWPNFEPCFRSQASWRNMLPQQPPTSTIGVVEVEQYGSYRFSKLAVKPGSVRMEQILEAVENGILMPTPTHRVFWTTVSRSLNFEIWGQNWISTEEIPEEGSSMAPMNLAVDWDTLRLSIASTCLEQTDCDIVIVSEWAHRLFQDTAYACHKSKLDNWLESKFGECEVVSAREPRCHVFKAGKVPVLRRLCERCCCFAGFPRRLNPA